MKYDQKQRSIPQLSNLPFSKYTVTSTIYFRLLNRIQDKNLFPKELWSTLEGEEGEEARRTINKGVKKLLQLSRADSPDELSHLTPEERKKQMEDRMKNIEDDEAGGEEEMFGENDEEEEEDVDYENDEAEMGGDYDAEQYFDDGDKDDDGDDAGGDDY
jgi:DNA-directed RNA polymerase III subunit RPC7